jgi:porphobilinogen synthase
MNAQYRIKKSKAMLRLVRPLEFSTNDLIYPIFIREDEKRYEIPSLKGQEYLSINDAVKTCEKIVELGIPGIMIFGVINSKDADGSVALQKDAFHTKIFRKIKSEFGDNLVLISNLCLCDFTKEEYCVYTEKGKILNEKTAKMLGKIAAIHAEAGADVIAPAAMAEGQIKHIRESLDEKGFNDAAIMTYIKTDSCLFQPFYKIMSKTETPRTSVDTSKFRIDIINDKMFMQKAGMEIDEGADIVIVKPALPNLDLILRLKQQYPTIPVAAYQVSGEYAMIKATAEQGLLEEEQILSESLSSIKRAGADMILTYHAMQIAQAMKGNKMVISDVNKKILDCQNIEIPPVTHC